MPTKAECRKAKEEIQRQIHLVDRCIKSGFPQDNYKDLLKAYYVAILALDFMGGKL